ncbi:HAD like protein [Babesia gibsoni]|uniref:HAD like protein n=1 Tax=Babesia gibsoni TaxID=33632 RepID=A0AAD8LKM1_BABGI|nr:HAD like protein [Babesia gibsoni]
MSYPVVLNEISSNDREGSEHVNPETTLVKHGPPPKYFGVDMDGTLLSRNPNSMRNNMIALEKATACGFTVFLCTGRTFSEAVPLIPPETRNKTGFNGYPGIYQNGSIVYDAQGRLLRETFFKKDVIKLIMDTVLLNNHEKMTLFLSRDQWFVASSDDSSIDYMTNVLGLLVPVITTSVEYILNADITKVIIVNYDKVKHAFRHLSGKEFISKCAQGNFTDLTPPGITKGSGLEVLLKELKASSSDCAFIGDAENDIEAMEFIDYSFAVGNAKDSVKAHAKYVLEETNEEGAFAKAVSLLYGIETD